MPADLPRTRQPLMAQLAERRRDLDIRRYTMAGHLGVGLATVTDWEHGRNSPKLTHVVTYAERVGWRLVLHDGSRVLAEGLAIPCALPGLRKASGLTQRQLAPLLHVGPGAIGMLETRGCTLLASNEAYAAGLGLTIGLDELAEVLAHA